MKTNESEVTVAVMYLVGMVAVIVLSIVWGGFWMGLSLSVLWGWFAAPLFGLPLLTIWQAYGLVLVCRVLQRYKVEKSKDSLGASLGKAAVLPPFIAGMLLGVGWCVKAWA